MFDYFKKTTDYILNDIKDKNNWHKCVLCGQTLPNCRLTNEGYICEKCEQKAKEDTINQEIEEIRLNHATH